MTPQLQKQHLAHKQRLARITARAYGTGNIPVPTPKPVAAPEEMRISVRREYDTPKAHFKNAPIAWRVKRAVAQEFGISVQELEGRDQHAKFTTARFVAVGLFMDLTQMSYPAIGRQLGGRDHTTMLHAAKKIGSLLQSEAFANRYDQIKRELLA